MKRSSKHLALLLAAFMLTACGLLQREGEAPVQTTVAGKPAPAAKPKAPAPKPPDKGDPDARFKAALELLRQKQTADAESALTGLVKDFPQFSGPLTDLGILYAKSKRPELAISAFSKAVTDNPQNPVAYNWLGILYREARDYGRAEQAYRKALAINGDYAAAHLNLGILYDEYLKRPAEALAHYREYQRLGGADDLRVLVWVAQIEQQAQAAGRAAAPAASVKTPPTTQTQTPSEPAR